MKRFNNNGQLTSLSRDIEIDQFERIYSVENIHLQIDCNFRLTD